MKSKLTINKGEAMLFTIDLSNPTVQAHLEKGWEMLRKALSNPSVKSEKGKKSHIVKILN